MEDPASVVRTVLQNGTVTDLFQPIVELDSGRASTLPTARIRA
ncbi:MAG TPA: hypothetical protein VGO95_03145 [Modestobacter sp.]|nr:hypothetical protein [Modestobacter sp.]